MSEKLDGVRAIWDGSNLISRNGNKFHAPEWFTNELPSGICLDGELWMDRGKFQATASCVRKKIPVDVEWRDLKFMVFDAPCDPGKFEERIGNCYHYVKGSPVASILDQFACSGNDDAFSFFAEMENLGAEGIIFRAPRSEYVQGRTDKLMKMKRFDSSEAVIIGHEIGNGRLSGLIGAVLVNWNGIVFRIGSGLNDLLRCSPPPIGSLCTFNFCGLTDSGVPRFPVFQSVRDYE